MERSKFTVIRGGGHAGCLGWRFVSAYVTDTRLMGVVGLQIHWELRDDDAFEDFYQFFYFDAEEYGLDNYKSYRGSDEMVVTSIEEALFGGLGGRKMSLARDEAVYLVKDFCRDSQLMGVSLPEPKEEYQCLLEETGEDEDWLLASVMEKMCTEIRSDQELIHYFLMRSFGKDKKGLSFLCDLEGIESGRIEDVSEPYGATLCKNTIEEFVNEDGSVSYLSESLIEVDRLGQYRLVVTETEVEHGVVTVARRLSAFTVTAPEVAMMLSRSEFVTVFEVLAQPEETLEALEKMLPAAMGSVHENGRLFMAFHKHNEHVNRSVFRLNDDVQSLFFLTNFGQLIVGAYSLSSIWEAERKLQKSSLGMLVVPTAKFEFKEPVLLDFVQSDYEDFDDFLNDIKGDQ